MVHHNKPFRKRITVSFEIAGEKKVVDIRTTGLEFAWVLANFY